MQPLPETLAAGPAKRGALASGPGGRSARPEGGERRAGGSRSPARPVPRWLLAAVGGYLLAYVAWQIFRWGGSAHQELIGDLSFLPLTALAVVTAWQASRRCAGVPRLQWAWRLIALALLAYGLGDIGQTYYEMSGFEPSPSWDDPVYLSFYPLFLAGILAFPRPAGERSGSRRVRAAIDSLTVMVGGGVVVWYLVLGPNAYASAESTLGLIVTVAYSVGDLVLIVALARLLMGLRAPVFHRPLQLLGAGLLLYIVGDVVYGYLEVHGGYSGGEPVDLFWTVATAVFALAAITQVPVRSPEQLGEIQEERRRPMIFRAALPYLAVLTGFGLLIGSQAGDSFFPGLSIVLTAVLLGVLVSARQFLAQRELMTVHRQLRVAHDELAALATTDPLTALPNHRALVTAIDREVERARRYGRSCALLFLDIDYFKALNDSSGHEAGDTALREFANLTRDLLRGIDTIGRWGGEEFVAVLPEIDVRDAMATAERIRSAVAAHAFSVGEEAHLTTSIGVACYPDDGVTRRELLQAADRAMYTAKRMGRNQTFSAGDPTVQALAEQGAHGEPSELDERAALSAVEALAALVEARDKGTGRRASHAARLAQQVALALGCTLEQAWEVYLAAKLHDIGKVAVADAILRKPGRLTAEEWELMRRHPTVGAEVVARIGRLAALAPIIRSHHEHFDGGGYPEGLKGEQIPLEARIVSVADAFDAMLSEHPYRGRLDVAQARAELRRCAGTQFDPDVVAVLERILDEEAEARREPGRHTPAGSAAEAEPARSGGAGRGASTDGDRVVAADGSVREATHPFRAR